MRVAGPVRETGASFPQVPSQMSHDASRRRFLTTTLTAAAVAPLAWHAVRAEAAAPAPLPKLDAHNPTAKALAYSENAATVKHPKHKAGDHCANCNFFKAPAGQAYGPCTLFPKNSVAAKGWCSAWAKKP